MKHYKAPWGTALTIVSVMVTLLCVGIPFGLPFFHLPKTGGFPVLFHIRWLPLVMPPICALYVVRGFTITPSEILVRRLFWTTRLPRAGLISTTVEPCAMRRSIRTCGNGGFYSITGWYWNKKLGSYRAFVTDLNRTVVLRYADRTIVVSPDNPEDFANELAPRA